MSSTNKPSKKHHFVPQAQLRRFAADAEQRYIYVLAKDTGRSFQTSILNAGSENDFNTISVDDSKWNFEELFQDVDGRSASLLSEIVSRRSLGWLTQDDHLALLDLFSSQFLRTHFCRISPKNIAESLRQIVRQMGYDPDLDPHMAMPSEAAFRYGAVKAFLGRGEQVAALSRLVPALYTTSDDLKFITSDHPICLTNPFPYGQLGLTSPGIIVSLPISPQLMVTLHCPTILQRFEHIEDADIRRDRKTRLLRYREGLRSGSSIDIGSGEAMELNQLQVTQSIRFIYSATNSFDFARDILRQHPKLRKFETHVEMGNIGHAPQSPRGMPLGVHLVIIGPLDHCMLAIEEIDEAGKELTARTRQVELLAQIAADKGILHVELYVDGQVKSGLSQATIELVGEPSNGWFRVAHRDPSLRALCAQLNAQLT